MKSDAEKAEISELEKAAIIEELERVLAHQLFRNSVRCGTLLRYVVVQDLQGNSSQSKERSLGIEVFGRRADYDLNQDPVVRVAASEVRKKLAQYYQEDGHKTEISIYLPAGSYVPKYRWPEKMPNADPVAGSAFKTVIASRAARISGVVILTLAVAAAAFIVFQQWTSRSRVKATLRVAESQASDERFWAPVLKPQGGISICVAAPKSAAADSASFPEYAFSLGRLGEYLGKRGHRFEFKSSASVSSADRNDEAAVKIGEFVDGKSWSISDITGSAQAPAGVAIPSRYSFGKGDGAGFIWIQDPEDASSRRWSIEPEKPASELTQDFAILAQFNRKNSFSIVIAGLGVNGTIGAINCLVDASCMEQVYSALPKTTGLGEGDIEAVLRIPIVDGTPQLAQVVGVKLIPRKENSQ